MYDVLIYKDRVDEVLKLAATGVPIAVVDLETTGRSKTNDYIFQFAVSRFQLDKDIAPINMVNKCCFIKPVKELSATITEITGFTNEDLKDKPDERTVFPTIKELLDGCILCSHNIPFEEGFLSSLYERCGSSFSPVTTIDTLKMSRDLNKANKSHKLADVAAFYELDTESVKFHDAREDVLVCRKLLLRMFGEYTERKPEDTSKKAKPRIQTISFWQGKSHTLKRIYIGTNYGTVWFSTYNKAWGEKDKGTQSFIDMNFLEKEVLRLTGCSNLDELSKFTGSIRC